MNKLPWFTHDHSARDDEFIQLAIDKFGHFGYAGYFMLLELIHQHGTGGILKMSKARIAQNLRSRWPQVERLLDFCRTSGKVQFNLTSTEVELQNKKFIERQRKLKFNAPSMLHECSVNAPQYKEREREEHILLSAQDSAREKKPAFKQTTETAAFRQMMDQLLQNYLGLKPGDPDPKERIAVTEAYKRFGRAGKSILAFARGDPQLAVEAVDSIASWLQDKGMSWTFDTCVKWLPDYINDPGGFGKNGKEIKR